MMNVSKSASAKKIINLYFQVHQPRRLNKFEFSDIGSDNSFFNDKLNGGIIKRIAEDCYLPANRLLLKLIEKYPGVKCTFSISGCALDQFIEFAPQVIVSFQALAQTGCVEFLGETYFHSLSYLIDIDEFKDQVNKHRRKISDLFGQRPRMFRNTDLIYTDALGQAVFDIGFDGMYVDGVSAMLNGRTSGKLYRHPYADLTLFPRNYMLSDAVAFGYSERTWSEWPLTPEKFVSLMRKSDSGQFVGIGMGYETFGEHKKASEGIFTFLEGLITLVAKSDDLALVSLAEAVRILPPMDVMSSQATTSWADKEKDLSAWLGNELQKIAFDSLKRLYDIVRSTGNSKLMNSYRNLQTSDHFYYISTKGKGDQEVHDLANHYGSPYKAFRNYMNILSDFELEVKAYLEKKYELV